MVFGGRSRGPSGSAPPLTVVNLVEEGVDLAIHNGKLKDSTLIVKKIATTPVITIASAFYLKQYGEPANLSELDVHRCVGSSRTMLNKSRPLPKY
jgi:DNA-binding transcriptional LysR family regulator